MNKKIITLSFDDGEDFDIKVADRLREYGLMATFYLCSSHIGMEGVLKGGYHDGRHFRKLKANEIEKTYKDFEIGSHCENHQALAGMTENEIYDCIKRDIDTFQKYSDRKIVCLAYPGGYTDDGIIEKLEKLKIVSYARGVIDGDGSYLPPQNKYKCIPTSHIFNENIYKLIDDFEADECDGLKIFHIYGHSYEIEWKRKNGWEQLDKLFARLKKVKDADYFTNSEAYNIWKYGTV